MLFRLFKLNLLLVCTLTASSYAHATSSELSIAGSSLVVLSPLASMHGKVENPSAVLAMSPFMVVAGVALVGSELVKVTLKGSVNGIELSFQMSKSVVDSLSLAVGQSVKVVALSTGNMLVASGKVLAFIPNQLGQALLHQSKMP